MLPPHASLRVLAALLPAPQLLLGGLPGAQAAARISLLSRAFTTGPSSPLAPPSSSSAQDPQPSSVQEQAEQCPTLEHPLRRLQTAVTPQLCDSLRRKGFAVVDGVFGPAGALAFRQEIQALRAHMHMNSTHLVTSSGTAYLEKSHIHEAELMSNETQQLAPLCAAVQHDNTLGVMLSMFMPEMRLDKHAVKLQWNDGGGGCFPIHLDSDDAVDTRRVTAIIYLNPEWQPGDGGELRLYPFPAAPVDIQPLHDRMVLFSSMRMPHRVLPSSKERYCFTIWLSDTHRLPAGASKQELHALLGGDLGALAEEDAWRRLLHPAVYKHSVKWAHRHEWALSLQESHPPSADRDALLEKFWREVGVIERALGPLLRLADRAVQAQGQAEEGEQQQGGQGQQLGVELPQPAWF